MPSWYYKSAFHSLWLFLLECDFPVALSGIVVSMATSICDHRLMLISSVLCEELLAYSYSLGRELLSHQQGE